MVVPEMPAERVGSNFLTGLYVANQRAEAGEATESRGRLASHGVVCLGRIELPVTGPGNG